MKDTYIGCAKVSLIGPDICYITYKENYTIRVDDLKDTFEVYAEYAKMRPLKILMELPQTSIATSKAAKFAEKQKLNAIAEAIFIQNLAHRTLIRFLMIFKKKRHPVKVFPKRERAIKWLKSI